MRLPGNVTGAAAILIGSTASAQRQWSIPARRSALTLSPARDVELAAMSPVRYLVSSQTDMLDENWTPSVEYAASLYFHCPNTNCNGHVKLQDRSRHHLVRCEQCGLEFAIAADPDLRKDSRSLVDALPSRENTSCWVLFVLLALISGIMIGLLAKG